MATYVNVYDLAEEEFPSVYTGEISGNGHVPRSALAAALPAGEELRVGHYLLHDEGGRPRAEWLGTETPPELD